MSCLKCKASLKSWMRYCTKCGAKQIDYQWHDLRNSTDNSIERLNVDPSEVYGKSISLTNTGSSKVQLHLNGHKHPNVRWIDFENLKELLADPISLEPGGPPFQCRIPFVKNELDFAFEQLEVDASLEIHTVLEFKCTDVDRTVDNQWSFYTLKLPIYLAKQPFISPNLNLFRFLSWERLEEGVEHIISLGNYSPENRVIKAISFQDIPDPQGYALTLDLPDSVISKIPEIELGSILEDPKKYRGTPIETHKKENILLNFQLQSQVKRRVSRFCGLVSFELNPPSKQALDIVVGGLIGKEPRIELKNYNPLHQNKYESIKFVLHNSGDLPIKLTGVSIYKSNNENIELDQIIDSHDDWLLFKDSDLWSSLQPEESTEIEAQIIIANYRSVDNETFGFRRVVFHHENDARFPTVASVQVEFGTSQVAENVFVGIDFGTSNSMVSVVNGVAEQSTYEMKTLDIANNNEQSTQLSSLLWYTSTHPEFYVGNQARDSAGINWANLVRSMKTVVNRDANEQFSFIHQSMDHSKTEQNMVKYKTAQELMNFFIDVLCRSSERDLSGMVSSDKERLGLKGANITLSKAIFTHPVDISEQAFHALMTASHEAGVNVEHQNIEDFKKYCCVDESTAAALYFVYSLINQPELFDYTADVEEKVLCIDIGGGTSDITLMHYEMDDFGYQTIKILPSKGLGRLGGDQLDTWLAELLLSKVEKEEISAGELDSDLLRDDLDNLKMALKSYSYQSFTDTFQSKVSRLRGINQRYENWQYHQMLDVYRDSSELQTTCEQAKIRLSDSTVSEAELSEEFWSGYGSGELDNLKITKQEFNGTIQQFLSQLAPLIDSTLAEAYWSYDDVSIILFTGQTTYIKQLRELVDRHVSSKRVRSKKAPFVVHPDRERFDPKSCVAKGGALYPILNREDSPLDVIPPEEHVAPVLTKLPNDIYLVPVKMQGKLKPLRNFLKDASFPVNTNIELRKPRTELSFYSKDAAEPLFTVRFNQPIHKFEVSIETLDAEGVKILGVDPEITSQVLFE